MCWRCSKITALPPRGQKAPCGSRALVTYRRVGHSQQPARAKKPHPSRQVSRRIGIWNSCWLFLCCSSPSAARSRSTRTVTRSLVRRRAAPRRHVGRPARVALAFRPHRVRGSPHPFCVNTLFGARFFANLTARSSVQSLLVPHTSTW
jgi:hypothetical protein